MTDPKPNHPMHIVNPSAADKLLRDDILALVRRHLIPNTPERILAVSSQVTVKPLVWDDHGEAKGGGAKYLVYEVRDGWNCTCYPYDDDHYRVATAVPELLVKAAAQADYEARILSALTIHPADFDPLGR